MNLSQMRVWQNLTAQFLPAARAHVYRPPYRPRRIPVRRAAGPRAQRRHVVILPIVRAGPEAQSAFGGRTSLFCDVPARRRSLPRCRAICSCGKERLFLMTDLANPTSNAIYARIGYRALSDFWHFDFVPAPAE